jgi:hypothetical protein
MRGRIVVATTLLALSAPVLAQTKDPDTNLPAAPGAAESPSATVTTPGTTVPPGGTTATEPGTVPSSGAATGGTSDEAKAGERAPTSRLDQAAPSTKFGDQPTSGASGAGGVDQKPPSTGRLENAAPPMKPGDQQ